MRIESKGCPIENQSDTNAHQSSHDIDKQLYGEDLSASKSSPSAQSSLKKHSRTVYSIQGSKKNSAPWAAPDDDKQQAVSPSSRRSVFQKSISRDVSPSAVGNQQSNGLTNVAQSEFNTQCSKQDQSDVKP